MYEPTLVEALWTGVVFGVGFGVPIGAVLTYFVLLWCGKFIG